MNERLSRALELHLGARVISTRPVAGGDINEAFAAELADGRRVFIKTHPRAPRTMYAAEARGLAVLAEARAVATPQVIAVSEDDDEIAFLALGWIESAPRAKGFDEELGRALARLHRTSLKTWGLDHDNFIGSLPQENGACATWADFYRERRLLPQLALAEKKGRATPAIRDGLSRLCDDLEARLGPPEPIARLHGDLWGGNVMAGAGGEPVLIDPAVHGGHREVDLAMMRLFGGFGPRVFQAYDEAYPRSDGHEGRVPIYQLYYLLAHVNLFGGTYVGAVERALRALAV